MKKTIYLLTALMSTSALMFAQTADEIINKNITAMGGMDKLNSIKTIYEEDSLNAGGVKLPLKLWQVNKKSMRAEFSFNGMVGFSILRNDSGWNFVPFQGQTIPAPATADEVKKGQEQLYVTDAFVDYKDKGYKVTYEGKDETEGSEAYKIMVKISDSVSETYYIDPDTYYVIQVKGKTTENGKVVETTETRSDYKKTADGFIFPMEDNNSGMGDMRTYVVKVNTPIDNKIFSPSVKVAGK
jgi:hypothetical protein